MRNGFDTLCPDSLVKFRIDSDVVRAHCFACKVDDGFDGPGSTAFEGTAVYELVKMDGVFSGDDVLEGGTCLASLVEDMDEHFCDVDQKGANLFLWSVCNLKDVYCELYILLAVRTHHV